MQASPHLRTRTETLSLLQSQFTQAKTVGGFSSIAKLRTASGIKDTFQSVFIDRLTALTKRRGRSIPQKQLDVAAALRDFPEDERIVSPVWRIRGVIQAVLLNQLIY